MGNILREIFSTELTEKDKELLAKCEEWRKEAIEQRQCIACKHYSYDHSVPGFVHYEGDCDLGKTAMFGERNRGCFENEDSKLRMEKSIS